MSDKDYLDSLLMKYGHRVFAKWNTVNDSVYIGRGSVYGNPIRLSEPGNVELRIQIAMEFRDWCFTELNTNKHYKESVKRLHGRNVHCYCSNGTTSTEDGARYCHGHILLAAAEYLNR